MKSLIAGLMTLVLATILLAALGAVPAASAVTWLILVSLVVLTLVVFTLDRGSGAITPRKRSPRRR